MLVRLRSVRSEMFIALAAENMALRTERDVGSLGSYKHWPPTEAGMLVGLGSVRSEMFIALAAENMALRTERDVGSLGSYKHWPPTEAGRSLLSRRRSLLSGVREA